MKSQPANVETWKRRATRLLRHGDVEGYFRIDDRGVWPVEDESVVYLGDGDFIGEQSPESVFGQWRPARVLAAKGYEIDPADSPALPFPFDAKELAAFMVNGMGAFVAEWYCDGDWDNGLSIEVLERSLPVDESWLRQTVREAIDAYRVAKEAIGRPDGEHPDPDEIVWQLLKPDDAPAAPPTGQQDAPGSNGNSDAQKLSLIEKPQSDGAAAGEMPMKKEALIGCLEKEWPSIRSDFQDASRNGLKEVAHAGKHGQWHKAKVREWGISKGKLKNVEPPDPLSGAWSGPSRKHRI